MNVNRANLILNKVHSNTFPSVLLWLTLTELAVFLLMVQTLPMEARDALILVMAGLILLVSIINFEAAWVAFILFLPFVYVMAGMFGQAKITGLRIFLLLFMGVFLLLPKPIDFWPMLRRNLVFVGLGFFFLANLVSAVVSRQIEAVFRSLTFIESLVFFLLSCYFVRRRPGNWRTLLWAIGVSGAYVILLGFLELAMQKPLIEIMGIKNTIYDVELSQFYISEDRFGIGGRISSILLQPVYAGLFFSIYLISQTYYIAAYKKRFRQWLFVLIPLGLGMVILTGSRGPILALGAALIVFLAFNQRKGFTFGMEIIGLGVLAFLTVYLVPGLRLYMQASFDLADQTSGNLTGRFDLTLRLFEFFKAKPIFGYGPGLIQKAALQGVFGFEGLGGLENQYATILADGGLLAGAAYLIFIYGVFALATKAYRNENRELQIAGTMLLALAAYYSTVVISVNAISAVGGYLFMIIVGGLAGLCDNKFQALVQVKEKLV